MTLNEAIATLPAWVGVWLNILMLGGFVIPVLLLFWKSSRIAGIAALVAGAISAVAVGWMYNKMGYVKLLGLPHIIFYTPLVIYYISRLRSGELPKYASWLMAVSLIIILISLAFDYTDALRYLLGNRTPMLGTLG